MARLMRFAAACVLVASGLALGQNAPQAVVPIIALEDQFERAQNVTQFRGHVLVLIYGDKASAEANKALGEQIHVAFHPAAKGLPPGRARQAAVTPIPGAKEGQPSPDVVAVPVALIGKVPAFVKRIITGQFRSASPDVPVWLDFGDVMKKQFPFKAGVPNVVVIDKEGRYRYAAAGKPTAEGTTKLLGIIEGLRRE